MESVQPFFMSNPDWYTTFDLGNGFPEDGRGYHLTDKAPQEAIDSYNDFYALHDPDSYCEFSEQLAKALNEL